MSGSGGVAGPALNAAVGAPLLEHVVVRPGTERYWRALKEVMDPELPISVVDMGLIYEIQEAAGAVKVVMTYTATACPCMSMIQADVRERLMEEAGVEGVEIDVVWSPAWNRSMLTEEGKAMLRKCGVAA